MNFDYIIPPVDKKIIEQELNSERFIKHTNKGDNELYIVNYRNAPNVVKEIGRLREITFATEGGGTGKEIDIDEFDTSENCYNQLIVYDPEEKEIISGYRFIDCSTVLNNDQNKIKLSTKHYFNFSEKFIKSYLPYTIELGRSWVQPLYQSTKVSRKGIFALDNLWDGLGALVTMYPKMKYFFGKVTMYTSYNVDARNALLYFINSYFPDLENLVTPIHPISIDSDVSEIKKLIRDKDFNDGLKELHLYLKEHGEKIPPLINTYMRLSSTMKSFGTAINPDFGGVEETGILVTVADIYEEKKERHIN